MIAVLLAGLQVSTGTRHPPNACDKESACVQASAAQLFALAEQLFASGDKAAATEILQSLTQDKHPELRAEARFRLAAVLESMGDLKGAARALRDLLAEQPKANRARLELARILGRMGRNQEAKAELAQAEKLGLPPEVEQNVRRFSATLAAPHRRGLTLELTAGPDTNINRSTSSQFIDTIIAPFELDPNARRQGGIGYSGSAQGYVRNSLSSGVDLLSDAAIRADLYDKARFDDVQAGLNSGPEFNIGNVKSRAALRYERRWYGGSPYSKGLGGDLDVTVTLSATAQLALSASSVRQRIAPNSQQDGWRTALGADLLKAYGGDTLARASLRYGRLDARVDPESLRQLGGGLLLARQSKPMTLFGEIDYTRTHGIAPQFLFGKTRRDSRWDFTAGAIFRQVDLRGFSPLLRLTQTVSSANIALYQYRRTRLDFGVTGDF